MPDLVAAGLARHRAIAVDFARHGSPIVAIGLDEPVDRLVAGPMLGMEPGVDHQPACAEAGRLEIAELAHRIVGIDAKLVGQLLGIERPAFAIGVERQHRADQRHAVGIVALPDVAGNSLMITKSWKREFRPFGGAAQIDIILARHLAVDRSGGGIAARCSRLDRRRHALDHQLARNHRRKCLRQARADIRNPPVQIGQQLLASGRGVGIELGRILAERRHPFADRAAGHALLGHDRFHAGLDRLHLLLAELMDLVRRAGGRGPGLQCPGVIGIAVLEVPHAGIGRGGRTMLLQLVELAPQPRETLLAIDCSTRSTNLSSEAPLRPVFSERRDDRRLVRPLTSSGADDFDCFVESEVRRDHADCAVMLQPLGLAVDVPSIGVHSIGKCECVLGIRYRMATFKKSGRST